jgi:hypothetical protein
MRESAESKADFSTTMRFFIFPHPLWTAVDFFNILALGTVDG